MQNDLAKLAIDAALQCDWERAIDYNTAILRQEPNNLQALNRLARAYLEIGNKEQAQELCHKVLEIDRYNPVALKNLQLIPQKQITTKQIANEDFIEKPGETLLVSLIKLTNKDVLNQLYSRQPVELKINQGRLISVYSLANQRLGALPDDLSFRLKNLIKKGFRYQACIKSAQSNKLTIFIRETKRPKKYQSSPSFSDHFQHKSLKQN